MVLGSLLVVFGSVPSASDASPSSTASCTTDSILPVVQDADFYARDVISIVDVEIVECQNGYARVVAISDRPDLKEQVFLKAEGDKWRYLVAGSGIDCRDDVGMLGEELIVACEALGLRSAPRSIAATPTFTG